MDDLISKKEVLQTYGISYGALYRWKRMGLIPEEWFVRRATPTGQETFFHRGQICPRVEMILSRGENTSLEELAAQLQPQPRAPVRRLVVSDGFSTRSYRLDELQSVRIIEGDRELDLLPTLKGESL